MTVFPVLLLAAAGLLGGTIWSFRKGYKVAGIITLVLMFVCIVGAIPAAAEFRQEWRALRAKRALEEAEKVLAEEAPPKKVAAPKTRDPIKDVAKDGDVIVERKHIEDVARKGFELGREILVPKGVEISVPPQKGVRVSRASFRGTHVDIFVGPDTPKIVQTGVLLRSFEGVHISMPVDPKVPTIEVGFRELGGADARIKGFPTGEFVVPTGSHCEPFCLVLESMPAGEVVIKTDTLPPGHHRFTLKKVGVVGPDESEPGRLASKIYR